MRAWAIVLCVAAMACGDDGGGVVDGTTGAATSTGTSAGTSTSSTSDASSTTGEASTGSTGLDASTGSDGSSSTTTGPIVCNEPTDDGPSFAATVWPILDGRCSDGAGGCHQSGGMSAGLVLDMEVAYTNLVCVEATEANLFRVNPGDPEGSYWFAKLSGTQVEVGGLGSRMPLGSMLMPDELEIVEAWIVGGATP